MNSIKEIEKIENSSVKIKDTYVENYNSLKAINLEQTQILEELSIIEEEIELLIKGSRGADPNLSLMLKDPSVLN